MSRVLVVAAHPDDEILGVGGTILRHIAAGDTVRVHIEHVAELRDGDARMQAAKRIAELAGYELEFGHSRQLGHDVPDLDAVVAEFNPTHVYAHHWSDLHRDHRAVWEAVAVACRPFASDVRQLVAFETPSSTEWGAGEFNPNLFVDINPVLERKSELLAEYAGELRSAPHPRSDLQLRMRARAWGGMSGYWAAEAFVQVRTRW